jgi:hypothetical protein
MASENKAQSGAPSRRAPPPALNPESLALVQPWKDFVSKGLITELIAKFTPMSTEVYCQVNPSLSKEGDNPTGIPIGEAKGRIIEGGHWTPRGQSKPKDGSNKELLPLKSLVKKDFDGKNKQELAKRAKAVALALTDTTARGRIGSLKLMREGIDTFDKWWRGAPPEWKSRLLSDSKHYKELDEEDHIALAECLPESPFRGTVPTPSPEEEETKKQAKPVAQGSTPERRATPPKRK